MFYFSLHSSVEQKERWLSLIKRYTRITSNLPLITQRFFIARICREFVVFVLHSRIKEEKEKDHPKTIPLKVHAKDMGNFSYVSSLMLSNEIFTSPISIALRFKIWCSVDLEDHCCEQFRQRQWSDPSGFAAVWDCGKFLHVQSSELRRSMGCIRVDVSSRSARWRVHCA